MTDECLGEQEPQLVEKKGTTSHVWTFFGLEKEGTDSDKVICRVCKKSVLARGGNTSNLVSHLKNNHPKEHSVITAARKAKSREKTDESEDQPKAKQVSKQVTLSQAVERTQPYLQSSKRWQQITNSVTMFMAKEMMPESMVERPGFKEMLHKIDLRYTVPSRKYFSKTALPSLYTATRDKISDSMRSLEYYSITTDMWSSERWSHIYCSLHR